MALRLSNCNRAQRCTFGTSRVPILHLGCPSPLICHSQAGNRRGFGDAKSGGQDERTRKAPKSKRVNVRREEAPIPNQGNIGGGGVNPFAAAVSAIQKEEEDEDFLKRLAVVRMEGQERRKDVMGSTGGAATAAAGGGAMQPVFDTGQLD